LEKTKHDEWVRAPYKWEKRENPTDGGDVNDGEEEERRGEEHGG
jgi:hypothetical protein